MNDPPATPGSPPIRRLALLGNPNTGKTTLFNRLCGIRSKTANFPGSTVDARIGTLRHDNIDYTLIDLPGIYGLNLDRPESKFCLDFLAGRIASTPPPDAVIIVADATNLPRNLIFVNQALQQGLPAIVVLNMIDLAQRRGLTIDQAMLSEQLGCPVFEVCARSGEGVDELIQNLDHPAHTTAPLANPTDAHAASRWADTVVEKSVGGLHAIGGEQDTLTDRLDAAFTHPILGILFFIAIMAGVFYVIFSLATLPMDGIDFLFTHLSGLIRATLPAGPIRDLLADGVVAGVAGTVVFLPQIMLLFFLISILEDTGYLARASFVMDRLMRRFGLPGQAFVPLLSAHACALPAIMSARLIPDHRDRLVTILVAPFMSCSARLPVYVLLIGMIFRDHPLLAGAAFAGCYLLGAFAAIISALLLRTFLFRQPARPMVLELPTYKMPSLYTALLTTWDRALVFLKKAGTVIVAICIVLWWLGNYPTLSPPPEIDSLRTQITTLSSSDQTQTESFQNQLRLLENQYAKDASAHSFMGRIGRTVEPVFEPIGCDWQITIGVLSSFLAREVFVSTLAVVLTGEEDLGDDATVLARISGATRADGSPLFTPRNAASILIYFVLAMQCLPTLAVTRRETGSWKWAALQLIYMSVLAYALAFITYQGLGWMGVA